MEVGEALESGGGYVGQRLSHRSPCNHAVRRDFGQRNQNERALEQARMWQRQFRFVEDGVVIGDQIEIQRARSPAFFGAAVSAEFSLDLVQREQQRVRVEAGVDLDAGVDETSLVLVALWRRGVVGRTGKKFGLRHAAVVGDGLAKSLPHVSDVSPECDQDAGHCESYSLLRVSEMPTSSKIAGIGACGLCTAILIVFTRGKVASTASATAPAARSSSL